MTDAIRVTLQPTFFENAQAISRLMGHIQDRLNLDVGSVGIGLFHALPLMRDAMNRGKPITAKFWAERGELRHAIIAAENN